MSAQLARDSLMCSQMAIPIVQIKQPREIVYLREMRSDTVPASKPVTAEGMRMTATTKPRMKSLSSPKCSINWGICCNVILSEHLRWDGHIFNTHSDGADTAGVTAEECTADSHEEGVRPCIEVAT